MFSCLKSAESGDGIVLRMFNPNPTPEEVRISGADAKRIRMDEEASSAGGFELTPREIATFLLQ